ncbi:MAG: hypothetical protein ACYTF7_11895 [Planctomycetota bacterium]|jgi:hypothetical protein
MRACVVATCVLLSANLTQAALLKYTFTGEISDNSMTSGDFAGASAGETSWLAITVNTSIHAHASSSTRQTWTGISGVITNIKAHANSTTRTFQPGSLDEADIWNDDLDYSTIPGNVIAVDSFRLRVETDTNTDHMGGFIIDLSAVSLGNTFAPSSLEGTHWPTQSTQLNPASFNNARFMGFFEDTTYSNGVFSELSSVSVEVVPLPSTLSLLVCSAGAVVRRRR